MKPGTNRSLLPCVETSKLEIHVKIAMQYIGILMAEDVDTRRGVTRAKLHHTTHSSFIGFHKSYSVFFNLQQDGAS